MNLRYWLDAAENSLRNMPDEMHEKLVNDSTMISDAKGDKDGVHIKLKDGQNLDIPISKFLEIYNIKTKRGIKSLS